MSLSGWRWCAVVGACCVYAVASAQLDSVATGQGSAAHVPVKFLHDQFQIQIAGDFASASLRTDGEFPGRLGLSPEGLAVRLSGLGYRQNGVPFQAGELYWQGGSGEELGVRSDRMAWEGEPLGFPPSGARDPALLPGPQDSAYLFPVPMFGYEAAELVLWRDPLLPDSAKATARYTNGPAGYSYTGGRFRTELGAGFETDAQVYRIFSDGLEDSSGFDGHNLDMELRRQWGQIPMRVRFRQNRAHRDLLFRWQQDPARASHQYYLTHFTIEAAHTAPASEWLLAYDLRAEDQEKRLLPALSSYQYWFDRRHRISLSRLYAGRIAYWGAAAGEYRERDSSTGLPGAFQADFSAGMRWTHSRTSLLLSGGSRLIQEGKALFRGAAALRFELFRGNTILAYAGASREAASPLRQYLQTVSGAVYSESGEPDLPLARHVSTALAWRHDRPSLSYDLLAARGSSSDLSVWEPSGDTASLSSTYTPVATRRSGASLSGHVVARPWRWFELEGSWRHQFASEPFALSAAYAPRDTWYGAVRVPLYLEKVHLLLTPEWAAHGAQGGTLPESWSAMSVGIDATLKQLTVFWHKDNLSEETLRTGGAYPWYGAHSRFGFYWSFWN